MRWEKLGKIFDPTEHHLPNNCKYFAQAPQALVLNDFVRIYFSTRSTDETGKFLSHIAFVDMEKNLRTFRGVSQQTVLPLGKLGTYDEHGIFPLHIFRKNENEIFGYICGLNRRVSVSIDASIGLAITRDNGITFERCGDGPILTSSLHEPFLICDPFVQKFSGNYHMWYVYGTRWLKNAERDQTPSRIYKIGHAISDDGIRWKKDGKQIIQDVLNADECQALPTVFFLNNRYHMYFCYRQAVDFRSNAQNSYKLGYAFSNDLQTWTRNDSASGIDLTPGAWDSDMMCYPHTFSHDGEIYLLYNGNEFGKYGFGLAKLVTE